jgi:hypothetical protein
MTGHAQRFVSKMLAKNGGWAGEQNRRSFTETTNKQMFPALVIGKLIYDRVQGRSLNLPIK